MKKVIFCAATAILFASCNNNGETADNANQAKIDSMSQELLRQHIVDSMNNAITAISASGMETVAPVMQGNGSSSNGPRRSGNHSTRSNSSASSGSAPVGAAPTAATNVPTGPTAAEIEAKRKADNRKKAKSAATGAVIGAGAGAIGGAISGKNEHFKKENAAIGAGVGAVVGAGAGLLLQKRKLKKESQSDTTQR